MAYVSIVSTSSNSVTAKLAGLTTSYSASDRRLEWYVDGSYRAYRNLSGGISESPSQTFYNLSPGTTYTITAVVSAPNWEQDYEWSANATTDHLTPSISSFTVTQDGIGSYSAYCSWRASNLESGAWYEIEAQGSDGRWWTKASGSASSYGGTSITFDSFKTYNVRLTVYNSSSYSASRSTTVTMKSVNKWEWSISNSPDYNATAAQTQKAYNAVTGKGYTTDFSYLVWNDMCAKVREIRLAVGNIGAWDTANGRYLSYNNTLMSASDKVITAARFNSLKYQIGSQVGTGINDVSKGDTVYGWYFTTLATRMNYWIDNM